MIVSLFHVLAVLMLLIGAGLLPARALVGNYPLALATAPLATAVACSMAAVASLTLRVPLALGAALVFPPLWIASLVRVRRAPPSREPHAAITWRRVLPLMVVLAIPLLAIQRAPVDWDATWIWFFHSDWFSSGGPAAADALANPDFLFAHPDYPPLAPATVASIWMVLGRDYELAQLTIALLIASATLVVGLSVQIVTQRLSGWLPALVSVAVVLSTYGVAGVMGTNGYVDVLWAAAFVSGALCLLLDRSNAQTTAVGGLCITIAMLTKNEGMAAGVVVLILVLLIRGWRRGLRTVLVPTALAFVWTITSRSLGAEGDLPGPGRLSLLLHLDPEVTTRVGPILSALWRVCRWEFMVAFVLTAVGLAVARRLRFELTGAGPAWLWLATLGCLATVVVAYLLSPYDIEWHLATSVSRTTLATRLMLLAECGIWVLVLLTALARRGPALDGSAGAYLGDEVLEPA